MGRWRVRKSVPLVAGLPAATSMRRSAVFGQRKNQHRANFFVIRTRPRFLKKGQFFRGGARDCRQRGAALAHSPSVVQMRQAPRPVRYGTITTTRRHRTAPFSPSNRPRVIRECLCLS